jgi:hypothetical protein
MVRAVCGKYLRDRPAGIVGDEIDLVEPERIQNLGDHPPMHTLRIRSRFAAQQQHLADATLARHADNV